MTAYSPCPSCRRHIKDATCPFCGTLSSQSDRSPGLGRVSRAVVFAGVTVAAACGGSQKKTTTPDDNAERRLEEKEDRRHYQDHPCYDPDPAQVAAAQKKVDEAKTDEERSAAQQELQRVNQPMCAPYGAPPARRRIV
jgi:hypothetical protein